MAGPKNLKEIPKLDDANDACGKNSIQCTLILSAGDSANILAESGLSRVRHDRYGFFRLCVELLNVGEASHSRCIVFNKH